MRMQNGVVTMFFEYIISYVQDNFLVEDEKTFIPALTPNTIVPE